MTKNLGCARVLGACALMLGAAWLAPQAAASSHDEAPGVLTRAAPEQEVPDTAEGRFIAAVIRPKPGLSCKYTCLAGGTQWTLLCSKTTESECCEIANAVCPALEPGSTGTVTCSC
jgi:hypothetical protein